MKGLALFSFLLLGFSLITSCDNNDEEEDCTYVTNISADQNCYAGNGLVLTAERDGPQAGIEWSVYAVKDSAVYGWTDKDLKIFTGSTNTLTVPDSIVKNYKTIIATANVNCNGIIKYSIHYFFVPTHSAASNCTIWTSSKPN
jgi:hypothetical protein